MDAARQVRVGALVTPNTPSKTSRSPRPARRRYLLPLIALGTVALLGASATHVILQNRAETEATHDAYVADSTQYTEDALAQIAALEAMGPEVIAEIEAVRAQL